jgi:hypothetical protein
MIDRTNLKSIIEINNEEVKQLALEAEKFLNSHHWCKDIENGYLALVIAGVTGVFLFDIIPSRPEIDKTLWVVTGDLPAAYLVTDEAKTWQEALDRYVYEMDHWVSAVREGGRLDDIIPVNVEPTLKHAEMLEGRLEFIQEILIDVPLDSIEGDS